MCFGWSDGEESHAQRVSFADLWEVDQSPAGQGENQIH